jgi:membrane protein involved in colicin uptake
MNIASRLLVVSVAFFGCLTASAAEPQAAPAAAAVPTTAAEPAANPTATADAAKPAAAPAAQSATDDPVVKVPAGYKAKVIGGETVYCRKSTPMGTRFPTEVCMTVAQYQDSVRDRDGLRQELTGKQKSYSINN